MADIALLSPGVSDAPEGYTVPGAQEIILKAVTASFDGSAAIVPFVPTLQIIAPNGTVLASCPVPSSVAAGASADVSWFPRGGLGAGGSPGGGIEFDTDNEGGWLDITTRTTDPSGFGMRLQDAEDGEILIDTDNRVLVNTEQNGDLVFGTAGGGAGGDGNVTFGLGAARAFTVQDDSANPILEVVSPDAVTVFAPLKVEGPAGATAATRYAGATASGAPIAGTFEAGDFVVTHDGAVFVCTVAGTPGTWANAADAGAELKFDFDNQGGYLEVTTNASNPPAGAGPGLKLVDTSGGGIALEVTGAAGGDIDLGASAVTVTAKVTGVAGEGVTIQDTALAPYLVVDTNVRYAALLGGSASGANIVVSSAAGFNLVQLVPDAGGSVIIYTSSVVPVLTITDAGAVTLALPTSPGAAGTLWNNAGVVTVA